MKKIYLDGEEIYTWDVKRYLRMIKMTWIDRAIMAGLLFLLVYVFHALITAERVIYLLQSK